MALEKKIRKRVQNHDFIFEGQTMHITGSIGIHEVEEGEKVDESLKSVDQQLYISKQRGKNITSTI